MHCPIFSLSLLHSFPLIKIFLIDYCFLFHSHILPFTLFHCFFVSSSISSFLYSFPPLFHPFSFVQIFLSFHFVSFNTSFQLIVYFWLPLLSFSFPSSPFSSPLPSPSIHSLNSFVTSLSPSLQNVSFPVYFFLIHHLIFTSLSQLLLPSASLSSLFLLLPSGLLSSYFPFTSQFIVFSLHPFPSFFFYSSPKIHTHHSFISLHFPSFHLVFFSPNFLPIHRHFSAFFFPNSFSFFPSFPPPLPPFKSFTHSCPPAFSPFPSRRPPCPLLSTAPSWAPSRPLLLLASWCLRPILL